MEVADFIFTISQLVDNNVSGMQYDLITCASLVTFCVVYLQRTFCMQILIINTLRVMFKRHSVCDNSNVHSTRIY